MGKITRLLLLIGLIGFTTYAHAQRGFSFQGYARDASGAALAGQTGINVQFELIQEGSNANVYSTTNAVATDAFGVFSTVIGEGDPNFGAIDFLNFDYRLNVSINGTLISSRKLDAVPYAKMAEKAANGVPPGTILPFGGNTNNVPDGFVVCDGSSYTAAVGSIYVDLYNAIGNAWGGTGINFNVPDLRGYFIRGWAGSEGTNADPDVNARTGGEATDKIGSKQGDEFRTHNHGPGNLGGNTSSNGDHSHAIRYIDFGTTNSGCCTPSILNITDTGTGDRNTNTTGAHTHTVTINSGTTANQGGSETRPKNAYVLYIIKL